MKNIWLIGIILIGSILRLSFLDQIPGGLHFTESTLGFRVQNIINFGTDEYGRFLPLLFANWKDFELLVPTYLTVPFLFFSQSSIFLLRLPFAIMGILSIVAVFLLTQTLYPQKKIKFYASLAVAINPWGVWLSRFYSPEMVAFTLGIFGSYFYLSSRFYFLSVILFPLALLSSKSLAVAIFILPAALYFIQRNLKKLIIIYLIYFPISFLHLIQPQFIQSVFDQQLGIFSDQSSINTINLIRGANQISFGEQFNSLFYNKLYIFTRVLENIFSYLNLRFIFASTGDNGTGALSMFGLILIVFLPIFIIGCLKLIRSNDRNKIFLSFLFLLSFLPVFFLDRKQDPRFFLMALLPCSILIGLGMENMSKKAFGLTLWAIFLNLSFLLYDTVMFQNSRIVTSFNPSTIQVAQSLGQFLGVKQLQSSVNHETIQNVWLTDNIDPNSGPSIGFVLNKPYKEANLTQNSNIYKGWISQIAGVSIGNASLLKTNPEKFDLVIMTDVEKELYKCPFEIKTLKQGERKYLYVERCYGKK